MTNPIELSKHVADKFHAGQMYGEQLAFLAAP